MSLSKSKRAALFAMFDGHCAYCGCVLNPAKWDADHIEPIVRDGKWVPIIGGPYSHKYLQTGACQYPQHNHDDNYYPSCKPCNISKSAMSLKDWRSFLSELPKGLRRDHSAFRHAERFGLIEQTAVRVQFYFENAGKDGK